MSQKKQESLKSKHTLRFSLTVPVNKCADIYNSHELIVNRWAILLLWCVFKVSNTIRLGGLILGCHSVLRLRCFLPTLSFEFPLKHYLRNIFTNGD